MNWNAIGAVGELLGALGVIVSLLYLSNQLRGSIRQARLDAVRAVQTEIGAVLRSLGASPPLANAYARGVKGWDHLESEGEMMMLSCTYISMLRSYEELIRYRDQGLVDEWAWSSVDSLMKSLMSSRGSRTGGRYEAPGSPRSFNAMSKPPYPPPAGTSPRNTDQPHCDEARPPGALPNQELLLRGSPGG